MFHKRVTGLLAGSLAMGWFAIPPAAAQVSSEQAGLTSAALHTPEAVRIDLGDGYFMFALDPSVGADPPKFLNDVVTWEYAGQAIYASESGRVPGAAVPMLADKGPEQEGPLQGLEMEDQYGRLFRVKSVDLDKLAQVRALYDARIAAEFGFVEEVGRPDDVPAAVQPATGGLRVLNTWYRVDPDGDGDFEENKWDADNRELCTAPLTDRQEKVVSYTSGGGACTGVLVGSRWVLSAAHCATNSSGAWVYPRGEVCTRGAGYYSGFDCATVINRWKWSGYDGDGDFDEDWVILEIDEDLGAGKYMALSQASDGTLKDYNQYHIGYPSWTLGNKYNYNDCFTSGSMTVCESAMYWCSGEMTEVQTALIGGRWDSADGQSGGPIFYYPSGGGHYLTGIHCGFTYWLDSNNNVKDKSYNGGPKIPYWRDEILGVID